VQTSPSVTELCRKVANLAGAADDRWIALDEDDVIVACGRGGSAVAELGIGESCWDWFPGFEQDLGAILALARERGTGEGVGYSAWMNMFFSASARVVDIHRDPTLVVAYTYPVVNGLREAIAELAEQYPNGVPATDAV
jgi:hypothetical protein